MAQKVMYPGTVNSPETTLTNGISESDTIIYVLDPARVPEPPNLMTLGTGTNAETVKVTEINDTAITVQRGFQGVAKSWPAGTVIARNFTAYDHDTFKSNIEDIDDTVTSHLADYTKYGFGNRPYTVSYSTIYIDEANGDDTNDGLSEQTAVKTPNRLIQLIPIFLQDANFTIKIIGNLSALLAIPTVLSHSFGALRRLIVEGATQNKENHELSSGIRAYAVQCILEIRHVNVTANGVVCFTCTYVEINNVSSSLDTSVAAPISAYNGTNMYISNSEINNPSGTCIMSFRLSRILSRDNTGSGEYGLYANSGDIIKDATQPTGTIADEREAGGGVVR